MFQYRKVRNKEEFNIINKETKEVVSTETNKDDAQNKVANLNLLKKRKFAEKKEKKEKKVKVPKVKILKAPKSFATTPSKIKVVKFKEQNFPLIKKFRSMIKEKPKKEKVEKPKSKVEKPKSKVEKPAPKIINPEIFAELKAQTFKRSTNKQKKEKAKEALANLDKQAEYAKEFVKELPKEKRKRPPLPKKIVKAEALAKLDAELAEDEDIADLAKKSKANIRKYAREFAKEKELAKLKPEPKYNPERAKERRVKASKEALAKLDAELADEEIMRKFDEAVARDETRKIKEKKALTLLKKVVSTKTKTKNQLAKLAQQQAEAEEIIKFLEDLKLENTMREQKESLSKINSIIEEKEKAKEELKFITEKVKVKREKDRQPKPKSIIKEKPKPKSIIKEKPKPRPVKPNLKVNIPEKEKLKQEKEMRVIEESQMGQEDKKPKSKSIIKEKPKRTPEEIAKREAILAYNEKKGKEEEEKERMRQELEIQQVEIATAKEQARQQKEDQARVKKAEQAIAAIAAKEEKEKEKVKKQDFYTKYGVDLYRSKTDPNQSFTLKQLQGKDMSQYYKVEDMYRSNITGHLVWLKDLEKQGLAMYHGEGKKFYIEKDTMYKLTDKDRKIQEQARLKYAAEKQAEADAKREKIVSAEAKVAALGEKIPTLIKFEQKNIPQLTQKEIRDKRDEEAKDKIRQQMAQKVEVKEVPKKEVPKEYELSNRKRIFIDKDKVFYKGKEVGYFRKDKIYLNDMPSSSDNKTLSLKDVTEIAPTVISSVVSQIEVPPESAPIVWINPIIAPSPLVPFVPAPKVDTSDIQFSKYENKWGMYTDDLNTIYIDSTNSEVYNANSELIGNRDLKQRSRLNVPGEQLNLEDYNLI